MSEAVVKIGTIILPETTVESLYTEKKYVVSYRTVYQIEHRDSSKLPAYHGKKVCTMPTGMNLTSRGRYNTMNAEELNSLARSLTTRGRYLMSPIDFNCEMERLRALCNDGKVPKTPGYPGDDLYLNYA